MIRIVKIAVRMIARIVPFAYRDCMPDGSATPTTSLAKVCAQLSHNWNVAVQVNPITISAMLSIDHFALLISSSSEDFLPVSAFFSSTGIGRIMLMMPTATIKIANAERTVFV